MAENTSQTGLLAGVPFVARVLEIPSSPQRPEWLSGTPPNLLSSVYQGLFALGQGNFILT
jgi:hypothetical protein